MKKFEPVFEDGLVLCEVIDDTRSTSSVRMLILRTEVDRPAGALLRMRMLEAKTPLLP